MNPLILIAGAILLLQGRKKPKKRYRSTKVDGPITIGLFKAAGANKNAVETATNFLSSLENVNFRTFSPNDVLNDRISDLDIVFFTGGSGSRQGESLGHAGREKIRKLVRGGCGYIGICAGSYLALQGSEAFNKLSIAAGKNATEYWKRGNKDVLVQADTRRGPIEFRMHYENGPIFAATDVNGLKPFVPLGVYLEETWSTKNGTNKGEMLGMPVITCSNFGKGRILLFGPNPMLGAEGAVQLQMFLDAMQWARLPVPVPPDLRFDEVFPSKIPR